MRLKCSVIGRTCISIYAWSSIIKDIIYIFYYYWPFRLHVNFDILVILFSLFLYKFFDVVIIPRIWAVWVAAYMWTKERFRPSWDSSLIPPELADEPTWRHNIWIIFIVNINQSPILGLYRLCRSLIKWISSHICPANLWDVGPICRFNLRGFGLCCTEEIVGIWSMLDIYVFNTNITGLFIFETPAIDRFIWYGNEKNSMKLMAS